MQDVQQRFQQLAGERRGLCLYALVDGFQYHQHTGRWIEYRPKGNRDLFHATDDEALSHAGPWLFDMGQCHEIAAELGVLERALPSMSWLMTTMDLDGLAQVLQLRLNAALPDGKTALVRFYDPRVLGNLFNVMDAGQRADFCRLIDEWHFLYNSKRAWIGHRDV